MRTDLNMRKGKMIAQGAHASMMFLTKTLRNVPDSPEVPEYLRDTRPTYGMQFSSAQIDWIYGNFKKICVQVKSEEELDAVFKAAADAHIDVHMCIDSGLTEFNGQPTKTCLAIGPDYSDKIDSITGNLKLL